MGQAINNGVAEGDGGARRAGVVLRDAQLTPALLARPTTRHGGGTVIARDGGPVGPLPVLFAGVAQPLGGRGAAGARGHSLDHGGSPARRTPYILANVHRMLWPLPVESLDNPSLRCYGSVNSIFVIYC